jgi:hypothetical protein
MVRRQQGFYAIAEKLCGEGDSKNITATQEFIDKGDGEIFLPSLSGPLRRETVRISCSEIN